MRTETPTKILLKDYSPTPFAIHHVHLDVKLNAIATRVVSKMSIEPRFGMVGPLVFDGEGLELISISVDGQNLSNDNYTYTNDQLTIPILPKGKFDLRIEQICNPSTNTALSGLYLSNGIYCTQMEAQGFRRFAFFYDRPDVMATFDVRVEAPRNIPVLLANGNSTRSGLIENTDQHFVEWHDPHPKPSYLFALVAGDLAVVKDEFTTMEGRSVELGIYVEKGKENRCAWAMESLKTSMRWDETAFGRAYDLDVFNIVAVSDFNMGAMENKGLNVFNDKYILALPETATDLDHVNIEAIIAHEYFHNWTGNRITCRDWFQLCLKEGLTVFRDQEFTSDIRSRPVKRIQDVRTLRARQFPEDQGPLAHPVRPSSYIEINNFYTPTIYEKGAEICRMIKTIVGADAFRRGMDDYFTKFDGTAATVEDFIGCFAKSLGQHFTQMFRWYEQAGTPVVTVRSSFEDGTLSVTLNQSTAATPDQAQKLPLVIPLAFGLVDANGDDLPDVPKLLMLTRHEQTFTFKGIAAKPVISINRGFSAPCILNSDAKSEDLLFLMAHDSDGFNRWESAQTLARGLLVSATLAKSGKTVAQDATPFALALQHSLNDPYLDDAFKALLLTLPNEAEIAATIGKDVDSDHVLAARNEVRRSIASTIYDDLVSAFNRCADVGAYQPDPQSTAKRSLRSAALALLVAANSGAALELAKSDLLSPPNMTAEMNALTAILPLDDATLYLDAFLQRHKNDHLLIDKWLMLQAQVPLPSAAQSVEALLTHSLFTLKTPNKVYALIGGFTSNLAGFHAGNGHGYRVVANAIIALNDINPQVAARIATGFRSWRQFDATRRQHACVEMKRILAVPKLSSDVFEIITRTLGDAAN